MAKINRYTGDLKAFASNSTGTNRTVFGDVTQSDVLDDNVNADYFLGWEIVGVNDKPDKEDFNGLGFTLGQLHAYIHQMGVPEWDLLQEFPATGITNKNGAFYISQQIHTGQDPELDTTNTYWSNPLDMSEFFTDSGAADTYVFAPADGKPRPIAYTDGLKVSAVISNPCTGGAVTAEITGISGGSKSVKLSGGADPAAGDIDGRIELIYDSVNGWFELVSKTQAYAKITDTKASGVSGGTFTSGAWQTRTLNTKDSDDDLIVTLAGNQFTLQAGKYRVKASAPGYEAGGHKIRLRNITDGTTEIVGSSAYLNPGFNVMTHSFLSNEITITSSKVFELQHHCQTTDGTGFGVDLSGGGENAVYATIEIWRL